LFVKHVDFDLNRSKRRNDGMRKQKGEANRKEGLFAVKRAMEPSANAAASGSTTSRSSRRWLIINTRQARSILR